MHQLSAAYAAYPAACFGLSCMVVPLVLFYAFILPSQPETSSNSHPTHLLGTISTHCTSRGLLNFKSVSAWQLQVRLW